MKTGNILEDFAWSRATAGYEWRRARGGQLLVPVELEGVMASSETYRLGDKATSGLFRAFAALRDDPIEICDFANRYGLLGFPVTVLHYGSRWTPMDQDQAAATRDEEERRHALRGEFLNLDGDRYPRRSWQYHISLMRWLIEARGGARTKRDLWNRLQVNRVLEDSVWPFLNDRLVAKLKPISLISALWLQAVLSDEKEYRECRSCSTPIEISRTGGARSDAVFCSDACKSRDFRARRTKARSLKASGRPAKQIARAIDTDLATVMRWLEE